MSTIKRKNFFELDREIFIPYNKNNIRKTIEILNKDKLVIIKWLKNTWKLNFIKEFINKTNLNKAYFYFNKSDDIENVISSNKELDLLLNDYIQLYKNPKIIILQNISKVEWIKDFISQIYKANYKTILVWNTIKIWWIKELEIFTNININKENLELTLKYWSINEVKQIELVELKEKYLKLVVSDIFLNDIFKNYWVKSIDLYKFTITYLAENNFFSSLRELQNKLDKIQKISLKTAIDYVDFSIQEKILKRVYKYDLKTNKPITSKAKYYFTDNWIRNSLVNFELEKNVLYENQIFNLLELNNYNIYSWLSWKFDFTFYCEIKESDDSNTWENQNLDTKIYIQIANDFSKDDIKKEVTKFLKIEDENKKYILVENIEKLDIKKLVYDNIEIMEINKFLEKFGNNKT